MKLIEKHFVDHFLRDRGPDDYFSPSDYQEALEMYEAGFCKAREMAAYSASQKAKQLDAIKFELSASVYTLEDDEFETVFYVRDCLEADFKKLGEEEVKE